MSAKERHGSRDLTYSHWHRRDQIQRYVSWRDACSLCMIDLDGLEYCWYCSEPVALIELARDVGQERKTATVTRKLARRADLPAYLVFYMGIVGDDGSGDITRFRVKQLEPTEAREFTVMAPVDYARFLLNLRASHTCQFRSVEAA